MVQDFPGWGQYMVTGYVSVGIWKQVSGSWSLVTTEDVYVQEDVGSPGYHNVGWYMQNTYAMGAGVTAFGATIQASDSGTTGITSLYASWTVTAASGERSATPSGQLSTIVVRPI